MVTMRHKSKMAEIHRQELKNNVIRILQENKDGLTSVQIAILMDDTMPRNLLTQLKKDGTIKRRKGISSDGRLAFLYSLSKDLQDKEK
jgi:predicted transcriptional regulator